MLSRNPNHIFVCVLLIVIVAFAFPHRGAATDDLASVDGDVSTNAEAAQGGSTRARRQNVATDHRRTIVAEEPILAAGVKTPLFINAGGNSFTDVFGNTWMEDTAFSSFGRSYTSNKPIAGTSNEQLYQSHRCGKTTDPGIKYEIPLENGAYDVHFHFCETYSKVNATDVRVFNVWVQGSPVLENVDVFKEAGGTFIALVKKSTILVADGRLTIEFERIMQNEMISGLSIHETIQASPSVGLEAPTSAPTLSLQPSMVATGIRINAGGPDYIDSDGDSWVSDEQFVNTGVKFVTGAKISGTNDVGLYQSERWDVFNGPSLTYDIPVADGTYDIFFHWAEVYSKAQQPKKRVFDVFVEDELVFEDLDIFSEVGGYTALVKETTAVVEDGSLTIRFGHKIGDPKVCGIEIRLAPLSGAPSMEPSASVYPTAPTNSPVPSEIPSVAPSSYPTETLLPWTDLDESEAYTARHECSFVQAGDKFFLLGGREHPQKLDIYDYNIDTWIQGATAPKPFNHFQAVSHEGLIWVIGAFETNTFPDEIATDNVYVYDPANDVWMEGPTIRWSRGAGGLVVYKDKFYLVGGNGAGHDGGFVPWLDEYDPRTGEWTILPDAPHARDHFHAAVIGDKLYAAGGRRTIRGNTLGDTVKEVDVFDLEKQEWLQTEMTPRDLPAPRASAATAAFDGKLLIMGGETRENNAAYSRVDALDPSVGRWSTLTPMNHPRHGTQAIVSGGGVYVTGGSPRRGGGQQKKMEVYNEYDPVGDASVGGELGLLSFRAGSSVTIRHISGNQGVFVNSIEMSGLASSDFAITNTVKSRFLIPRDGWLQIDFEYTGDVDRATADLIVTYTSDKVLNLTVTSTRS